jgi:ribosomal protein S18 acetylase RimI-like enzyme
MKELEYKILNMDRKKFDTVIEWAAAEEWNPGLNDADCFFQSDPHGFFIGELDGKPIGCISAVAYGSTYGFMGFYMVKPEYRGQGYGLQLWNAAINYMGTRTVGLDGVAAQQDNYKKSGFRICYQNIRFESISRVYPPRKKEIVELSPALLASVLNYDRPFFPASRPEFIREWIKPVGRTALGYLEDGKLMGYGVIRASRNGYRIGPLFADTEYIAEVLFEALVNSVEKDVPVFMDVPEVNAAAVKLVHKYEMKPVCEVARMYKGELPKVDLSRMYGVTSVELG